MIWKYLSFNYRYNIKNQLRLRYQPECRLYLRFMTALGNSRKACQDFL